MINKFRQNLINKFSREELLEIIEKQNPELILGINRIEYVFSHKLTHLTWDDGTPVTSRPLTLEELVLLIDEPFTLSEELLEMGIDEQTQRYLHIANDCVSWARFYLKMNPRVYQILMMRYPHNRKLFRAGRRLGKTYCLAMVLLHYAFTHNDARCIVVTPKKDQGGVIFKEMLKMLDSSVLLTASITRRVSSPQHTIELNNGSTIRFFSAGTQSKAGANVVRGQEAHILVLDELDYMSVEDIEALLAMLQKTSDEVEDKILIGASTPTGQRTTPFFRMANNTKQYKTFWFPALCFLPQQKVTMADGRYKNIEDIVVGDSVQTEKGSQLVTKTYKNEYEGQIKSIKTYGNTTPICVTPNHPFAAALRNRKQSLSYGGQRKTLDWQWVESQDLQVPIKRNMNSGMWLNYHYKLEVINKEIDLLSLSDKLYESSPGRVKIKRIFERGIGQDFKYDFPRFVDLSEEPLAILCGWYLAEGNLSRFNINYNLHTQVELTLNANEMHVVEQFQNALNFYNAGNIWLKYHKSAQSMILTASNAPLAILLSFLCGRFSKTKELHADMITAPHNFQRVLLECYGEGDGSLNKIKNIDFSTSSYKLACQIRDISSRLGWISSISFIEEHERQINKNYGVYAASRNWHVLYNRNGRSMLGKRFDSESSGAFLIKSIDSIYYRGPVYNLEVANTHSYLVEGLLVHNCNPHWSREMELEMKALYPTEMGYRHEIEADWGEDVEGIYPRKYVEASMVTYSPINKTGWRYSDHKKPLNKNSFFVFGVDWNKVQAGVNIVILEWCDKNYEEEQWQNKIRVYCREEIASEEYTYTKAVSRIIELNEIFDPRFIYVDKGYGEMQTEMLHEHGVKFPKTGLRKKVRGVNFAESIEVRDPHTKIKEKKPIKPFMVDNLRRFLERDMLRFPAEDKKLEEELSAYKVATTSVLGRITFTSGGDARDDVHDALMLAALAITQNYDDLLKDTFAKHARIITGETFSPLLAVESGYDRAIVVQTWGNSSSAPVRQVRPMTVPMSRSGKNNILTRKKF